MKGEAAHAASLRRVGQEPFEAVAEFGDFAALAPGIGSIARYEDRRRLGAGKFSIRVVGMVGHPAHKPLSQTGTSFVPRVSAVVRSKDAVARAYKNHAFAGNHAGNVLTLEAEAGDAPGISLVFGN